MLVFVHFATFLNDFNIVAKFKFVYIFEFLKFVNASFVRFTSGDWGDLCEDDKALNEDALKDGDRLMGEYVDKERGWKIWIITEADRSVTTILFPSEY